MGLKNFFNNIGKKSETAQLKTKSLGVGGSYEWLGRINPFAFKRISDNKNIEDGYLSNDDIYSIISYIARKGSTLDLVLQEERVDGTINKVPKTDPLFKLLAKPNPKQTKNDYFYELMVNYLLTGSAYQLKSNSVGYAVPNSLYVLPSQYVEPYKNPLDTFVDPIRGFYFSYNATRIEYPTDEIIDTVMFDPSYSSLKGVSPLQAGSLALKTSNTVHLAESSSIENNGASGIISTKSDTYQLSAEEREKIDVNFKKRIGGGSNFNKILTLNSGVEYTEIGKTPKELDMSNLDINKLRKFCNLYGISSQLFNDPTNKTYSNNLKEAKASVYTDVVIPVVEKLLESLNVYLIDPINTSKGRNYELVINTNNIESLQKDKKLEAEKNKINSESLLKIITSITSGDIDSETGKDILIHTLGLDETFADKVTSNLTVKTETETKQ